MLSNVTLDYQKTKTKDAVPNSFQFYNLNVPEHLSTEASNSFENLHKYSDYFTKMFLYEKYN